MAKSIYTKIDSKYFKLMQTLRTPVTMVRLPRTHTSVSNDVPSCTASIGIWINDLNLKNAESNKDLYNTMTADLKRDFVTSIDTLNARYKLLFDYTMYDGNGCELDHSVVLMKLKDIDAICPLGVNKTNESVYRQVKTFEPTVHIITKNHLPYGIMNTKDNKRVLQINDISILIDPAKIEDEEDIHNSIYENPYNYNSCTISSSVSSMIPVFSSNKVGLLFDPIEFTYIPRVIDLKLSLVDTSVIVIYNDLIIDQILEENKKILNPDPDDPEGGGGESGGGTTPDPDTAAGSSTHKKADGSTVPDAGGFYDYYAMCNSTSPNALLVVEDTMPKDEYDDSYMIPRSFVIQDIPEVRVGDYVRYFQTISIDLV